MLSKILLVAVLAAPIISIGARMKAAPMAEALSELRDKFRVVLVFHPAQAEAGRTPSGTFRNQVELLKEGHSQLTERDVVVIPVPSADGYGTFPAKEEFSLRRQFRVAPDEFTVVLVGKDGGEKFRSNLPVTIEELDALIDAMPMRQQEVRDGRRPK